MTMNKAPEFFSVIVPVYNRPDEVRELLESLARQRIMNFEVIIVEDGSSVPCREVADSFSARCTCRSF